MNKFHSSTLIALDSAHVKFDVWNRPNLDVINNFFVILKLQKFCKKKEMYFAYFSYVFSVVFSAYFELIKIKRNSLIYNYFSFAALYIM